MYERKEKKLGIWLMYLRKSRQDDPSQTVEEVLAKHEIQLQEHAVRELGGRIAEENIYREVISGESIEDREEIKKVLERIEDPAVIGVMVIEPQRLSRGDLEDCGYLINVFRFTHTQVCTPIMIYDLENKMDRKFFQDELLRGRDYLEYTKEILLRGRLAAIKRGCYISAIPPLGYDRIKIGRDHTLVPNGDADLVRTIFDWYAKEGLTPTTISKRLRESGVTTSSIIKKWSLTAIREILSDVHYIGKVSYNKTKKTPVLENGKIVYKVLTQPQDEVLIAEGKHPAIIDLETWEAAQRRIANNRPIYNRTLINPLSGILRCSRCGLTLHPNSSKRFVCGPPTCFMSVKQSDLISTTINTLEFSELPRLEDLARNGDGGEAKHLQHLVTKLERQLQEYKSQENTQFELLETGKYSMDIFVHRHSILKEKIDLCQKQIRETKEKIPKNVDYAERADALKKAIEILKDPLATPEEQNNELKKIVKSISFYGVKSNGSRGVHPKSLDNTFSLEVSLIL